MSELAISESTRPPSEQQATLSTVGPSGLAWVRRALAIPMMLAWRLLRLFVFVLISPFLLVRTMRRSMTASSVSVLLIGIMTLNIIWGYPWTGMFAACISMMCIGLLVNHWMRPRLRIGFSLPTYTPAGQPCGIVAHCTNVRRLPAFDFSVSLLTKASKRTRKSTGSVVTTNSPANYFPIARPGDHFDVSATVIFPVRGIHPLPAVTIVSAFPFHLFRSTRELESKTTIAVTPTPLSGDEDAAARALLSAVGGWSHRLASGDALDYTGSREYQPGMPVRRWDFASWARLGRPIVREFQSPSVQSALLIVDTALADEKDSDLANQLMERALSLAASTICDLTAKLIRVKLYVTSELPNGQSGALEMPSSNRSSIADVESMQIRLANAETTERSLADERIREVMSDASGCPTLLLTSRRTFDAIDDSAALANVICVDQDRDAESAPPPSTSPQTRRFDSTHDAVNHHELGVREVVNDE